MYYEVQGIERFVNTLKDRSKKALWQCWIYLENKLKEQLHEDSYNTWDLIRSVSSQMKGNDTVIVGTNLQYAVYREYGRKPWTYPNFWAIGKRTWSKKITKGNDYDSMSSKDRSTVFLIARAIKLRGIEAKMSFHKVRDREKKNIFYLFEEIMSQW